MSAEKKMKDASSTVIKNLTRAGGSGSIRLIPVESSTKTPSQQEIPEKTEKPKKVYCPKIPTGRRVKKELEEKVITEKPMRNKSSNIRKERQRVKKEIIQSESVFSHGPAGKISRGSSSTFSEKNSAPSNRHEKTSASQTPCDFFPGVAGDVQSEVTVKEDDFEQLTSQKPLDLFSHSKLPPVCIPLCSDVFSQQKPHDLSHKKSGSESRIAQDISTPNHRNLHSPAEIISNGSYMLIKLPNCLPKSAGCAVHDNNPASNNEVLLSGALYDVPEGCIGKIKIHKSGRTRLILGELSFDMSLGTPCGFLQELVSIQPSPDARITQLGQLSSRLCCIPEFENSLS